VTISPAEEVAVKLWWCERPVVEAARRAASGNTVAHLCKRQTKNALTEEGRAGEDGGGFFLGKF